MTGPSKARSLLRGAKARAERVVAASERTYASRKSGVADVDLGRVEEIGGRQITGTVTTAGAEPVRVALFVNEVEVDAVSAPPAEDGSAHFRFPVKDMWRFCGPEDRVTVRVGERSLPMPGGGMHYAPTKKAQEPLSTLAQRLDAGELIDSSGSLSLPKYLDVGWQQSVTGLYEQIRTAVVELTGNEPFLVYGSLLGAVREGRPLGHDCDFDSAYVSQHTDPELVKDEAGRLAVALQERGFSVEARVTCIHVSDAKRTQRIDLYHLYFNDDDELRLAWGAVSPVPFRKDQWQGTERIEFGGAVVTAPRNAEALVATFYGPNWRIPNPGFDWTKERVTRATEAYFPTELRPVINWQDHWTHTAEHSASSFSGLMERLALEPELVVDLGCGDGRDVPRFVRGGARVLGVDRAPAAIDSARGRRLEQEFATFEVCDLADPGTLASAVRSWRTGERPVLFYARQLLDSITADMQAVLLAELDELMRPGDTIALEFRNSKDTTLTNHEKWSCGRRVVGPATVRRWLDAAGFETMVDVGSPRWESRGSNPIHLQRIVARRTRG